MKLTVDQIEASLRHLHQYVFANNREEYEICLILAKSEPFFDKTSAYHRFFISALGRLEIAFDDAKLTGDKLLMYLSFYIGSILGRLQLLCANISVTDKSWRRRLNMAILYIQQRPEKMQLFWNLNQKYFTPVIEYTGEAPELYTHLPLTEPTQFALL
jgi:hypothetical protein